MLEAESNMLSYTFHVVGIMELWIARKYMICYDEQVQLQLHELSVSIVGITQVRCCE